MGEFLTYNEYESLAHVRLSTFSINRWGLSGSAAGQPKAAAVGPALGAIVFIQRWRDTLFYGMLKAVWINPAAQADDLERPGCS
jgi:hypothetical protein